MLTFVWLLLLGNMERVNEAVESQPALLTKVAEYVPPAVMVWPFQLRGKLLAQVLILVRLLLV